MTNKSYYEILEIGREATKEEIREAYRRLALKWHPSDNNQHEIAREKFKLLAEAYKCLTDDRVRQAYDEGSSRNHFINLVRPDEVFEQEFGSKNEMRSYDENVPVPSIFVTSSKTSRRVIKRTVVNGRETIVEEVYEDNGKLKSKTINGIAQKIRVKS